MAVSNALRRCPVCRYQLAGLPGSHKCPECGFAYDDTMRIWWVPVIPGWVMPVVWVVAFIAIDMVCSGSFRNFWGLSRTESAALTTVVSALPLLLLMYFPRGFVAAGRDALSYRFPFRPVRVIPWNEVRVGRHLLIVSRVIGGVPLPLRLPTVGLPRRRRRLIHKEIADRKQSQRSAH